ncbi:hypothetical protein [Umezawaea beigongshangensis]|uniref:hypothetical protein n=1 Tax=Umezawaea beigongshangensis TaxID=2780383 RepID=UPI0018F13A51|nr:hypothetical protein [Umezawaea beigongshangensis]
MTTSARRLLRSLDPLPFAERQRLLARTARDLVGTDQLDGLLRDLHGRGEFARRAALHVAHVAGHREHVERCLSAEQTTVVRAALGVAVRLGLPPEVFLARLPHLSAALRQGLVDVVRRRGATALADALLPEVRSRYGDHGATGLLVACSGAVVAAALPGLEHAVVNWPALARRHPDEFLAFVEAELTATPVSWWPRVWQRLGAGVSAAAPARPARVLDLVERVLPHAPLPPGSDDVIGGLARHSPDRVARILLDPRRGGPVPDRRPLWRALAGLRDAGLIDLARVLSDRQLVRLLHELPPSRRAAVATGAVGDRPDVPLAVLDELPGAARAAEARRLLALRSVADHPARRLAVTARLSWDEASPVLREAVRGAAAEERARAYPLHVAAAAATGDPGVFGPVCAGLTRLANEQDPVRAPAISALAAVPGRLLRSAETTSLTRLMVDALAARDCSPQTRWAVRALAGTLIREGVVSRTPELVDAGLTGLEGLGAHAASIDLSGLDRVLPRGAEHHVFEALRPRITADAARGRYPVLLALAAGLGRRAWTVPPLQDLLDRARSASDDGVVRRAVHLWLAPPATRDERVAAVLARDPSTITLPVVRETIGRRRTDLLDAVIGRRLHGRFLKRGVRHVPSFARCFHRWLPRQVAAHAAELADLATASRVPAHERASAVRSLGRVPGSAAVLREFLRDGEVQVVEAALSALAWTDEPEDVIGDLLAHADTDRARMAVYAAVRCARFVAPDRLGELLEPLLDSPKVTARKEAVRLLAEHRPPGALARVAGSWDGPGAHRDVRRALVSATRWFLDDEAAWDLLSRAVADEREVALAVLGASPQTVARQHRARYAALVRTVAGSADPDTANPALSVLRNWSRWDDGAGDLLVRLVTDLGGTATWNTALTSLVDVCAASGDVEPLRVAAAGLVAEADRFDAAEDRDLPARQRLGVLVRVVARTRGVPVLRAAARLLAADLAATHRNLAVDLALAAVPWDEEGAELDALREVARLADRPALALRAGGEAARHLEPLLPRLARERVRAVAGELAADGTTAAGVLALAVTALAGRDAGWPESWRSLLRALRRHDDPDVRYAALETVTTAE